MDLYQKLVNNIIPIPKNHIAYSSDINFNTTSLEKLMFIAGYNQALKNFFRNTGFNFEYYKTINENNIVTAGNKTSTSRSFNLWSRRRIKKLIDQPFPPSLSFKIEKTTPSLLDLIDNEIFKWYVKYDLDVKLLSFLLQKLLDKIAPSLSLPSIITHMLNDLNSLFDHKKDRDLIFPVLSKLNYFLKEFTAIKLHLKSLLESIKLSQFTKSDQQLISILNINQLLEILKTSDRVAPLLLSVKEFIQSNNLFTSLNYNFRDLDNPLMKLDLLFLKNKTEEDYRIPEGTVHILNGIGVSSGIIQGVITHSMHSLNKIFVCSHTNPSMIEAIENSKGVITEIGGITCHAAITCREFNKPAVVRVPDAQKLLRDGDEIILNGGLGKIFMLSSKLGLKGVLNIG